MTVRTKLDVCVGCGRPMPEQPQQSAASRYRLDAAEVARIRALIRRGKSDAAVASEAGVTVMTVFNIRTRRTWSA